MSGHQLVGHECRVLGGERIAREGIAFVFDRKVFTAAAQLAVIDPDDDDRRNYAALDEPAAVSATRHVTPVYDARRVEEVLPVVEVQHGIACGLSSRFRNTHRDPT